MENTLKFYIGERKANLRITNQVYSYEIISEKNVVAFVFVGVEFDNSQFQSVNFDATVFVGWCIIR